MGCSLSGVEAREVDTLVIYQSKYTQSPDGTVGPTDVDRLAGAANYFASSATLADLVASGPEATLLQLIDALGWNRSFRIQK